MYDVEQTFVIFSFLFVGLSFGVCRPSATSSRRIGLYTRSFASSHAVPDSLSFVPNSHHQILHDSFVASGFCELGIEQGDHLLGDPKPGHRAALSIWWAYALHHAGAPIPLLIDG